jgi:hypothetical protein
MENEFVEATDRGIDRLITEFQIQSTRFWNERDIHWYLFHYLKQDPVFLHDYGTESIRAEFPTKRVYTEDTKPARGHYDLVILDPVSLTNLQVSTLLPWAQWDEFLPLVDVIVALEVKTWVDRTTNISEKADWDIDKLTDPSNAVRHGYFLNFVQLDFHRQQMLGFYQNLRRYLTEKARKWPKLRIVCVPHDKGVQLDPEQNWVH